MYVLCRAITLIRGVRGAAPRACARAGAPRRRAHLHRRRVAPAHRAVRGEYRLRITVLDSVLKVIIRSLYAHYTILPVLYAVSYHYEEPSYR